MGRKEMDESLQMTPEERMLIASRIKEIREDNEMAIADIAKIFGVSSAYTDYSSHVLVFATVPVSLGALNLTKTELNLNQ